MSNLLKKAKKTGQNMRKRIEDFLSEDNQRSGGTSRSNPPRTVTPKNDVSDEGWIVTPDEINRTLSKQQLLLDKLRSNNKQARLGAVKQLKVNLKYDSLFGLKILDQLFSAYTQYMYKDFVEIELLKLIHVVVSKSVEICKTKYTVHFYNTIKILIKSEKVKHMTTDNPLGKANIFYLKKLLDVFIITNEDKEAKTDLVQISFPIIIDLTCENVNFAKYSRYLMKNFIEFYKDEHVENVVRSNYEFYGHVQCEKIFTVFFPKHKDIFIKFCEQKLLKIDPFLGGSKKPQLIHSNIQYLQSLCRRTPEVLCQYVEKFIEFLDGHSGNNTDFPIFLYNVCKIFTMLVKCDPLVIYRVKKSIIDHFVFCVVECPGSKTLNYTVMKLLSYLGYHLKNIEFARSVVEDIFGILSMSAAFKDDEIVVLCWKALENIVDIKGSLVSEIKKTLGSSEKNVNEDLYLNHPNLQLRSCVQRVLMKSGTSKRRKSIDEGGGTTKMLELQQTVDNLNLKIAEQNLLFAQMKKKINDLEKKIYSE